MGLINVALICPFSTGPVRGNLTTVRRIAEHLPKTGCRVSPLSLDITTQAEQHEFLATLSPDLLHAFHAYHAGPTARSLARDSGIPYLLTITGSDLFDPVLCSDTSTRLAIQDADAISCFDPLVLRYLTEAFPEVADRIFVIPQGVAPLPTGEPFPRGENDFIILLPAAIRPVKGVAGAIEALKPLAESFPSMRLLLAGGNLDSAYAAGIKERIASLPWVHMLGEVPHRRMGDLFTASDIVLNCSLFEGGMANTLLEAMIMGKPVVAHDVLGNRALISHGKTGWLYKNDDELRELVRMMLHNPASGAGVGIAGRKHVLEHCSIKAEVQGYRKIYERILAG